MGRIGGSSRAVRAGSHHGDDAMSLRQLIGLSIDGPIRNLKRWMLDREIKAYYEARADLIQRIKDGHREQAILDREICELESRRRFM